MRYLFLLLFLFGCSIATPAQQRLVTGTVYEKIGTQEYEMIGATACAFKTLRSNQRCKLGTQTDLDGFFSLTCDTSYHYIEIQYTGYYSKILEINDTDTSLGTIILDRDSSIDPKMNIVTPYKPAIYLYPINPTKISVQHIFNGTISTTYPAYNNGWNVIAHPDGTIYNLGDKRSYEYLFWDGSCTFPDKHFAFKDGFVVKKEDLNSFLLEKLSLIGLNNKEINDFIVYWLPILNKNETNFIHFRINDDIDGASVLTVHPEPESLIRLFMEYKAVDSSFSIPPQKLQTYPRSGFTLVEWGGSKIEKIVRIQ